jgi:hypothetical protein
VLFEDVIVEFDELVIHAMHDLVRRSGYSSHYLVCDLCMVVDDALE